MYNNSLNPGGEKKNFKSLLNLSVPNNLQERVCIR